MSIIRNYIVVDDDPWNNNICRFNLKKTLGDVEVKTFSLPEEALRFIENDFVANAQPTVLFLDINMPLINGWSFLERYGNFRSEVKNNIIVYMLSSSISNQDEERAEANQYVKGFISKPLSSDKIEKVANAISQ